MKVSLPLSICTVLLLTSFFYGSCKRENKATTGFYYWKSTYDLNKQQSQVLDKDSNATIYIRFFDIKWDAKSNRPYPEAIVRFKQAPGKHQITPVIFITNNTFEKLNADSIQSLALKSSQLIQKIAAENKINYQSVQIDCDWTVGTRDSYFAFLKSLKAIYQKQIEATIRLHQVKYQLKTGIPPVDRGILMFYNMGKLSANLQEPNSIYNFAAADTYLATLAKYPLPLDIALPAFSWSVHIRAGKVIQVYAKIGRRELSDPGFFVETDDKNVFKALKSFFIAGVYIKKDDFLKLEESDKQSLKKAAEQVAAHLSKDKKRTIIYYELGNLNFSAFKASDFQEISAHF